MPRIGLTAARLVANENAAEGTVPSRRPPSVLPGVSGAHGLPKRTGTMAQNEEPNGVSMEAASSVSQDAHTSVGGAPDRAGRNGLPVVRPEVPECFPERSPSFFPKQEWAGRVTAIHKDEFDARLRNLTAGGYEVATIDLEEISPEDRARMYVGSLFHWVMGYERSVSGTRSNVSRIVFLNSPRLTERDLKAGQEWADRLRAKWNLD